MMMPAKKRYEIRVVGKLDQSYDVAFAACDIVVDGTVSVISAEVDAAELGQILDAIGRLGIELLDIHLFGRGR
jgi:hypothetical protein